ncbi:hypothetical protein NARC_50102 [Candidatus Nitrosocosmicus arcticus]|uniref:Uncharacterized protein n=1 Tax=Candidatus Nitrosocosmicus arcticus TaxID=2035267 RepID=A0A557SWG4_9ARCH|nr:hypothetical protein NARC_50102 [Candidatus Nitrosocosmicus arcticus]
MTYGFFAPEKLRMLLLKLCDHFHVKITINNIGILNFHKRMIDQRKVNENMLKLKM